MSKTVYFATGSPEDAAADIRRLRLAERGASLRVAVPAGAERRVAELASLRPEQMLVCRFLAAPLLWNRLAIFLGFSLESKIVCLKPPSRFRWLKFLAMVLPGRLFFSDGQRELVYCSRFELLRATWRQAITPRGPVCVISSASSENLKRIVASLRHRFPDVPLHGIVPYAYDEAAGTLFDLLERAERPWLVAYLRLLPFCLGKQRFRRVVVPCTKEGFWGLKLLGWLLPLGHVEVYNENLDVFPARSFGSLLCHALWRKRQRSGKRREESERLLAERIRCFRALPVGVLGSGSASYLKKIVPHLRTRFPEVPLHGLLPEGLDGTAPELFDSATILKPGIGSSIRQLRELARRPFQCWILPCTNEGGAGLKWLAWLLPLRRLEIYNELLDGFPAWNIYFLAGHGLWRMRQDRERRLLRDALRREERKRYHRSLPVGVIGSASIPSLAKIVPQVRARFPEARLHGLLPETPDGAGQGLFDSVTILKPGLWSAIQHYRAIARQEFQCWIVPCTDEDRAALKWLAWLLPVWSVEAYNEHLDAFPARNLYLLAGHAVWRMRQQRDRRRRALPIGVVGSASAYYLKKIVPVVRENFPGAKLHGLLPERLEGPARGLFDSVTILKPGFWSALRQWWRESRPPFQGWVIPCTDEPYDGMKLAAFLLPFGPRHIYNELADGFPARKIGTLGRHFLWRFRDQLSFQIFSGAAGRNTPLRAIHLAIFALRLGAGAVLLMKVRVVAGLRQRFAGRSFPGSSRANAPRVDLIYLDAGVEKETFELRSLGPSSAHVRMAHRVGTSGRMDAIVDQVNTAIRNSQSEFICLLDSRCRMLNEEWLGRLLEAFDEQTAQAGPQVESPDGGSVCGGWLAGAGEVRWNSDNAACWRGRPEWLTAEALPWVCLVIRRSVILEMGMFAQPCEGDPMHVDVVFSQRLAAHGWLSICNRSVTASFPAQTASIEFERLAGVSREYERAEGRS